LLYLVARLGTNETMFLLCLLFITDEWVIVQFL
jgi:hypothetical protein